MNKNITDLYKIALKEKRTIIGLMSGTSLDGLDIALCQLEGHGNTTRANIVHFTTVTYEPACKNKIKAVFSKQQVELQKLCLLHAWLGKQHGQMINNTLLQWGIPNSDIDVIASHGQTIYHAPKILHLQAEYDNATLQIGDADHIAVQTGIITLSDFRQKHIAAGGEGAPLALYGDYLLFSQLGKNVVLLNIGGIANFTYLDGSLDANKMFSTDVGPGNTLMDAVVQQHYSNKYFDENATIALAGIVNEPLLTALKDNAFFTSNFPKTTGPELFNYDYLLVAQAKSNTSELPLADVMATLCKYSADNIVDALYKSLGTKVYALYCSGGGIYNPLLMQHLRNALPNIAIETTEALHINPNAKEALLFAVLANEALCGGQTNFGNSVPSVSMGKVSFAL